MPVVTYVNSSAEVKALTDICCTSANAVEVVRSLGVADACSSRPTATSAAWVASQLPEVEIVAWDGYCPIARRGHRRDGARGDRQRIPRAEVLAHPECRPEVIALADAVLSTSQMLALRGGRRPPTSSSS